MSAVLMTSAGRTEGEGGIESLGVQETATGEGAATPRRALVTFGAEK